MRAVSFDTLAYVKKLVLCGVDVKQAETQAEALVDILDPNFTTKKEQETMVNMLSQDISLVRSDLTQKIDFVRSDLSQKIDVVHAELKTDMAGLKAELKADMAGLKAELKADMAEMRVDIASMKVELIKWGLGIAFAQSTLIVSILKFFH